VGLAVVRLTLTRCVVRVGRSGAGGGPDSASSGLADKV